MIPIKVIRSITSDRRAQRIGDAIGMSNVEAGLAYLNGTNRRIRIEKEALTACNSIDLKDKYPAGEAWIDKEWSTHYSLRRRRRNGAVPKAG